MADATQMIEDIDSSIRASNGIRLDDWEETFVKNVRLSLKLRRPLSTKQLDNLTKIWDRV